MNGILGIIYHSDCREAGIFQEWEDEGSDNLLRPNKKDRWFVSGDMLG